MEEAYYFSNPYDQDQLYDIYDLFQFYSKRFFLNKLNNCELKWSTRMTLCAGTCKFQGNNSLITLSEPLLKFRSNNELKETLLHEMIHAYLFMTDMQACRTEGGHGPVFQNMMHQLNNVTGLMITVYHSFHDEVEIYR